MAPNQEKTTSEGTEAMQPQNIRPFNPNEHLMQIKNRGGAADYLPVQWVRSVSSKLA